MQSIDANFTKLHSFIDHLNQNGSTAPSIICITETWLRTQEEAKLKKYEIKGYNFIVKNRETGARGGGVGIYVSDKFSSQELPNIKITSCESLFIKIETQRNSFVTVGCIYSSPTNRDTREFIDSLDDALQSLTAANQKSIIAGDFNIDLLTLKPHDQYYSAIASNNFQNLIQFPTRKTDHSETLIDHIITNMETQLFSSGIIMDDISDHFMTHATVGDILIEDKNVTSEIQVFSFRNFKPDKAAADIMNIDWSPVLNSDDPNSAYNFFIPKILEIQKKHVPIIKITPDKQFRQPYMTDGLRRAQQKRYQLYKKHKRSPENEHIKRKYTTYRNRLNSIMKRAEKDYYMSLVQGVGNNSQKLWHNIKDIIGKKKTSNFPSQIKTATNQTTDDTLLICEEINNFFSQVGSSLAEQIEPSETDPISFILPRTHPQSLFIAPITDEEVYKALTKIKSRKSFGSDLLHPKFIKEIGHSIVLPLTHIINLSISKGSVPSLMKIARIIPLHKTGRKTDPNNYRPISILPVLAKILETHVYKNLYSYVVKHKILSNNQYGFQRNKNTTMALASFIADIQKNFENKNDTLATYIDLKKAFDTVNHSILLRKMKAYGIEGIPLDWFKSYLTDRQQFVSNKGIQSTNKSVSCGVPQGSNLGPLLFLIYINDLPNVLKHSASVLFADDTTLYVTSQDNDSLREKMNEDLQLISNWFQANKLTLNINKTCFCHFRSPSKPEITGLQINGQPINYSPSVKYLGIHVDYQLSWKNHIEKLVSKVNMYLGIICRIKNHLNISTLKTIYHALIQSSLSYGIEIWGHALPTTLKPLITAQKKLVRVILNQNSTASTYPLFTRLGIRPLQEEITYRSSLIALDIANHPDKYDFQIVRQHQHAYTTRFAQHQLPIPQSRTVRYGNKGLLSTFVHLYNSIPNEIKQINPHRENLIKRKLSKHIWNLYISRNTN